ncbi:MAG: tRNA (adenosine(37)-N6)-threonylcarbamoyltransferase complex ATPase subunit type 1 TsaE [bacterium]
MNTKFEIISKSIDDTDKIAQAIAESLSCGVLICMYGDIGAGKTTLTKSIGKYFGIKEKITSPSFVILNEYHSGKYSLYHFDLYRLETEGLETILDELQEYSTDENALTVVEWAEFSQNELLGDRLSLKIKYIEENQRVFVFEPFGEKPAALLEKIKGVLA